METGSTRNSFNENWELTARPFATPGSISRASGAQIPTRLIKSTSYDSKITTTGTIRRRVIVQRPGSSRCHEAEANWSISAKCLGVAIAALLFYTKATMVGNIFTIFGKAITIVHERYQNDKKIPPSSIIARAKNVFGGVFDIVRSTILRVWYAVRAFFYGIAMFGAAFYGIFSPQAGRSYIIHLESKWHGAGFYSKGIQRNKNSRNELELPPLARILRQLFFEKKVIFVSAYLQGEAESPHGSNV